MRILKNGYQNANEKEKRKKGRHVANLEAKMFNKVWLSKIQMLYLQGNR